MKPTISDRELSQSLHAAMLCPLCSDFDLDKVLSDDGITTSVNIDEREKHIEVEALSRLFQEAIYMTRRLGFDYIWIDSLCIMYG